MLKSLLAIILTALFAGTAYFIWTTKFSPEAKALARVKEELIDPESARFRNFQINSTSGFACGEVNSKNKLGGYAGFKAFLVQPDGTVRFHPELAGSSAKVSEIVASSFAQLEFLSLQKQHCKRKLSQ